MPCCSITKFFRPVGLFCLHASLFIGICAMVKAEYLNGTDYNWGSRSVSIGLFTACYRPQSYSGSICSSAQSVLQTGVAHWNATAAFLVLETIIKGLTAYALIYHLHLAVKNTSKRAFNIALIVMMSLSLVFGLIGVSLGCSMVKRLNQPYLSRGWALDASMIMTIVAFAVNVIGSVLFGIGWKFAHYKPDEKVIGETYAPVTGETAGNGVVQPERQIAPQQVSININGQTMTAMLIPTGAQNVQPVASAPVVYMPPQSYFPPQQYAPAQHYIQHAPQYPTAEAANTTYV